MSNIQTVVTHKAVTREELTINFGPGRLKQDVVVPKGTRCHKLDAGSTPWVVNDLSFIANKNSILYHDAEHYGIRVDEDKLIDITPL